MLADEPNDRCKEVDLTADWYYVDDWADSYFSEAWGKAAYLEELGVRVLQADPFSDGSDVLEWPLKVAQTQNE